MSVDNYLKELKINRIGERTIKNHRVILSTAIQFKTPLEEWTRDDVNAYILDLQTKMKVGSVETYKSVIRKYFKWAGKPEIVAHIRVRMPKGELTREEILTVEEINRAIDATPSTLYKALIAFLFDGGGRISEATGVRVNNTEETDAGMIVSMPTTKTSGGVVVYRKVLCVFSAQYIRNHITYCGLKDDDLLFGRDESSILRMFEKIQKEAGLTKKLKPHYLRHAQATDMVLRGYQESIIRKKMGWSADSTMIARYIHPVDDDVINATIDKNGGEIPKKPLANLKQAEALKLADASLQLSKLSEENEALKNRLTELENQKSVFTKETIQAMIEARVRELIEKA